MKQVQSSIAVLCVLLLAAPAGFAQDPQQPSEARVQMETLPHHWYSPFTHRYQWREAPPVSVSNSGRIDALMRAGQLYLSLNEAIALALENNIDLEVQRYNFALADIDLNRARAGAPIRGVPTGGGLVGSSGSPLGPAGGGTASFVSQDPVLNSTLQWGHRTQTQQNTITTGSTSSVNVTKVSNFSVTQGFITGGQATLGYNNTFNNSNVPVNNLNPATNSNLDLTVTQPLLQGFGLAYNNRPIKVARNNLRVTDLVFQQQVMNTVAQVVNAYWTLVSFNDNVAVKKQALALSERLYSDNKKQVEIGTLAPIEIVRAEAEVAARQQDLTVAQTNVLQQETLLKNLISRNGIANPAIGDARIVPTDRIRIPDVEAVIPIQDLVARALDRRPDLGQSRIQIDNTKIVLQGTRNGMLPTINAFANVRNSGLAGPINTQPDPRTGIIPTHNVDPFFVGGYGSILSQLFGRNFPDYVVGLSLSIPLRNRAAQADMATQQLNLRQNELGLQKLINSIRSDVANALIGVQQARSQHQAAVKSRVLQAQTLDAEQKKLALGASTIYQVIQAQRDLANAEGLEVQALANYAQARTQLEVATGSVLETNNVEISEAKSGRVAKGPAPIPEINNNNNNAAAANAKNR
jgi:outer membrane protein TolC